MVNGGWAPSPIGTMHPECAWLPLEPRMPLNGRELAALTHRVAACVDGAQVVLIDGDAELDIVGEAYRQDAIHALVARAIVGRCYALLVPEPTNPYDANTLAVLIGGELVGYVPRTDGHWTQAVLHLIALHRRPVMCSAVIDVFTPETPWYEIHLLLPDIQAGTRDAAVVRNVPHTVGELEMSETVKRVALLVGSTELNAVGESEFQEALDALAKGRSPNGHRIETMALVEVRPDRRELVITICGRDVGLLRAGSRILRGVVQALERHHSCPVACRVLITGGKGGPGVRKTQFQVKLLVPALLISI